jgi:hypothetical protein
MYEERRKFPDREVSRRVMLQGTRTGGGGGENSPAKTASPPPYGAATSFQKYVLLATRGWGKEIATAMEEMGVPLTDQERRRDRERRRRAAETLLFSSVLVAIWR